MNKEEIKLRIQRLQAQSDYQKFEYSQITNYYIGIIAFLIAIYIPIIVSDKNNALIYTLILIALLTMAHFGLKKYFKKNTDKIESLSKEIEELYSKIIPKPL